MRNDEIRVGDTVRFRTWEDMSRSFPHTESEIFCRWHFISSMRELCGTEFVVTRNYDGRIEGHNTNWKVSADMLEPVLAIPEIEESTMALETILC